MATHEFRYLSVTEAADELGLTVGRIRQMLLAGEMEGHKLGEKQWAIAVAEVQKHKDVPQTRGRPRRGG